MQLSYFVLKAFLLTTIIKTLILTSVIFQCFFPKFIVATIWTLRTPRLIFRNSYEWLLLEINAYNCVRLMSSERTQVCTLIQTDLSKPEVSFFFYLAMPSLQYLKEEIMVEVFESYCTYSGKSSIYY